jgi:putative membrane protein
MNDLQAGPHPDQLATNVTTDSHFPWLQTQLALENTMLAWIHTAVTMIGFGFAIVQFFDHLHELPGVRTALLPNAPWLLGLALIFCGVLVLVTALWNYRWMRRYLKSGEFAPIAGLLDKRMHAPVYTVAIILTLIGIFAFFAVLLHLV